MCESLLAIVVMPLIIEISLKYCFSKRKIDSLILAEMFEENLEKKQQKIIEKHMKMTFFPQSGQFIILNHQK